MITHSEATAIALHSMIYFANKKDEIIPLKEIANKFDISEHHLSKVLQRLVKAGYLISVKGPKGGFQISKGKENSTFMEIYEIIEGKYIQKNCLFSSDNTTRKKCCCIMGSLLNSINNEFENFMQNHRINDKNLQF